MKGQWMHMPSWWFQYHLMWRQWLRLYASYYYPSCHISWSSARQYRFHCMSIKSYPKLKKSETNVDNCGKCRHTSPSMIEEKNSPKGHSQVNYVYEKSRISAQHATFSIIKEINRRQRGNSNQLKWAFCTFREHSTLVNENRKKIENTMKMLFVDDEKKSSQINQNRFSSWNLNNAFSVTHSADRRMKLWCQMAENSAAEENRKIQLSNSLAFYFLLKMKTPRRRSSSSSS